MKNNDYEIKRKLDELNVISGQDYDLFKEPGDKSGFDGMDRKMKQQDQIMEDLKALAQESGTLLGRTMQFPMADSYALYVVSKVNTRTVRLTWIDYCDAWVDDRIGYEGNLDIEYVRETLQWKDKLEQSFAKKTA